jgi:hypothetical protein
VSVYVVNLAKTVVKFLVRLVITPIRIALRPVARFCRFVARKIRESGTLVRKKAAFRLKTLKISIKNRRKASKPID